MSIGLFILFSFLFLLSFPALLRNSIRSSMGTRVSKPPLLFPLMNCRGQGGSDTWRRAQIKHSLENIVSITKGAALSDIRGDMDCYPLRPLVSIVVLSLYRGSGTSCQCF